MQHSPAPSCAKCRQRRSHPGPLLLTVLLFGCEGLVGDLATEPGSAPDASLPAHDAGADGTDAGLPVELDSGVAVVEDAGEPDASVTPPDAGSSPDAGTGSVIIDGGVYPGLPASCQGLRNRTHGSCADAYANPNYGSIAWAFRGDVAQAIVEVGAPAGFFDGDTVFPAKRAEYAGLVAARLDTYGLCAVWDGSELYVRDRVQDMNETFSLFTSSGRPRAGGHWQCDPSDEIPRTRPGFTCTLPPSNGTSCGNSGQNYFTDVVSMVEEVIREEQAKDGGSAIIDFRFKSQHVRGWRLKDDGYPFVDAVARKANARGYCIASSGWKWFNLKRGSNTLSEKYSVVTHVSLPDPVTQAALYNACSSDGILPSCEFIIEKGEDTCRPADF